MQACRFLDPALFLGRAESFLMRAEAENNIMLGICGPPGSPPRAFREDGYLATVEDAGEVVACAIRTPPYKAVITRAGQKPLECLVDDLAATYPTLPAVLGPEPDVSHFARLWSGRTGTAARPGMKLRLFETHTVQPLSSRPAGALRLAEETDLPIIAAWAAAFRDEADQSNPSDPHQEARERVGQRSVFVWDDGRPVSMAAWASRTARGVRVNFVYTPPEHRKRGYASACVADLTQRLLVEGQAFCCLYTDLSNPTSNRIYHRIGYHPVCDVSDVVLNAG
jgi:predicted GNAT family acetyltransferase